MLMAQNNLLEPTTSSFNNGKNIKKSFSTTRETLGDTVNKLLSESNNKKPETDPETFKAALDAVRFEHQRLQNEFMTLMIVNEHVQRKLDSLSDNNLKLEEMELNLEEN